MADLGTFDVEGARRAGYGDDEILQHLSQRGMVGRFDVAGAQKAGYSPAEILTHLAVGQAIAGVPRPGLPQGLQPSTGMERVGERVKQNVYMIPDLLDMASGARRRELTEVQYPPGSPEAQQQQRALAEYDAGLKQQAADTRQMVTGGATTPIGRALAGVTIAPRMAYEQAKGYYQDPSTLAGDIVTALPALAEIKLPTSRKGIGAPPAPPPEAAPSVSPEHQAMLDRANAPYTKELAAQDLATRQRGIAGQLYENVQNAHEAVRGDLNTRWEQMRAALGDQQVPTQPILDSIEKARAMLAGVPEDLRVFNQIIGYMDRAASEQMGAEAATALERGSQAGLEKWLSEAATKEGPGAPEGIPFNDARRQFTALGDQWERSSGNVRRAISTVKDAYDNTIRGVADSAGQGSVYDALKKAWHQYLEDWQGRGPLSKILHAQHPNYVPPIALGRGGELLGEQLGRYGATNSNALMARQLAQEMVDVTREGKRPPLAVVTPPPPPPPKPGMLLRHGATTAGKLIGGTLGGAVGHPFIGMGIGSEIGSEIAKRMAAERAVPPPAPPPDVYTRNLLAQQELLRAKSGEITPGQANANIQRMGVSTKVQRIGQPPAPPTELERTAAALGVKPEPLPARPTPTQFGFNRAIETGPQGADVGAKVRAEQPPMPRGERRAVPRSAGQVELENFFRQARRELGDNATTEQVMARVEELKKAARGRKPGPPPPPTR